VVAQSSKHRRIHRFHRFEENKTQNHDFFIPKQSIANGDDQTNGVSRRLKGWWKAPLVVEGQFGLEKEQFPRRCVSILWVS
jgi:hypothetical protein